MTTTNIKLSNGNEIIYKEVNGTFYHYETSEKVVSILENVRRSKSRIRIYLGDTVTGKSWNEEYDIMGYVGRSSGDIKVPLLIHNKNSFGGGAMLDHCIIKIVDTQNKRTLYEHENFNTGTFVVVKTEKELMEKGLYFGVNVNGKNHANFKSEKQAVRYADFMIGKRNAK